MNAMSKSSVPPLVRLWNLFAAETTDQRIIVGDVLEAATKRARLSDFGDDEFRAGLEAFLASVAETGGLHAFGRFYLRQLVIAMLVHRLKLTGLLRAYPAILEERISWPVFVLGLPRSGTTLLFNLLAQDLNHRYMFNWEAFVGQVPPEGEYTFRDDPRKGRAKWILRSQKYLMPELAKVHEFGVDAPEECTPILMQSFATQTFATGFDVPAYGAWLDHADHDPTYRHHRKVLQALQWKYPGKRWLLKAPDHLCGFHSLLKVYPEARCIHIHRDPIECVASGASLGIIYRGLYYHGIEVRKLGLQLLNRLATDFRTYQEIRDATSSKRFCDIEYKALVRKPLVAIREIYEHFGLDLTPETQRRMEDYLRANPKHKHGVHVYRPEDFGLDADLVREKFGDYVDQFIT